MSLAEAKRTLVKSPPELWAELSDPAALARHLGELGEIRIVRTEPERSVEWEAAQISGTVLIEPSGWGTKVTLTANRIDAAGSEARIDAPQTLPEPAPVPHPPTFAREPEATQAAQRESGDIAESQPPEPTPELRPDGAEVSEPGGPTPDAEVDAIEIVAESERAPEQAAEPWHEPDSVPVAEPETISTQDLQPDAIEIAPDAIELQPDSIEIAPEPRLGFFARLFRRRRVHREPEPSGEREAIGPAFGPVDRSCQEQPMLDVPVPDLPEAIEGMELGLSEPAAPAEPAGLDERATPDEPAMPGGQATPDEPATPDGESTPDAEATPDSQSTPDQPATPDGQSTPDGQAMSHAPATPDQPATPDSQSTPDGQAMSHAPAIPEEPATCEEPATPDVSAELAEAERLAMSQQAPGGDVTAVLTSVLDRLGAAHHRPFSRA
ncbi:MAG TPA: hypothetical protein VMB51_15355 [Solirubrobacteraceae bacterium]|nr:hypothetical protein [Solirubrobacteraceae bacterium]